MSEANTLKGDPGKKRGNYLNVKEQMVICWEKKYDECYWFVIPIICINWAWWFRSYNVHEQNIYMFYDVTDAINVTCEVFAWLVVVIVSMF